MFRFILSWFSTSILVLFMNRRTLGDKLSPKNVLMIIADDLRPQLECQPILGTVRPRMHTPHICSLARESLHLMQNHAPMAHCSPSRTATLTGRSVGTTHVWDLISYFRNVTGNFTTIPQFFKNKGYHTTGIGKIFHDGRGSGGRGHSCPTCSGTQDQIYSWSEKVFIGRWLEVEKSSNASWRIVPNGTPLLDTQIMQQAVKIIHERGAKREKNPFFISVGFHKPHLPFVVPEKFYEFYNPAEIRLPINPNAPVNMPFVGWSPSEETRSYIDVMETGSTGKMNTTFPDYKTLELRRGYYASVSYTDHNVGKVLSALREAGLERDTIVIFWGDHGWSLGEHGRWDKHTNFDTDTHCPLMIKVPGLTDRGSVSHELTGLIDLFPTLVELLFGKEVLEKELPFCPEESSDVDICREGLSLVPLLHNPSVKIHDALYTVYGRGLFGKKGEPRPSSCLYSSCVMGYSMQTIHNNQLYRYTENVYYKHLAPIWDDVYAIELYNRFLDPGENYNIVNDVSGDLLAIFRRKLRFGSLWSGIPH